MYAIRYSNGTTTELFSDPRHEELAVIDPVVSLEANKTGSFRMIVPSSHPLFDVIQRRKTLFTIHRDGEVQPIFQGVCISDNVDFYRQKTVICEGELTYFNDSVLRPHKYQNMTPQSLLSAYITEHNSQVEDRKKFTLGNVTLSGSIYCFTNMNSTMQEIQEDLLDDFGGYITIRYEDNKKYVDYTTGATEENVQPIQLGVNLLDYQSNIDSKEIATRVVPLGATLDESQQTIPELDTRLTIESVNGGKDYLQASTAVVNQYGIITKVVEWNDVTVASILKSKGQAWLNDNQFEDVTVTAKAFDLGYIDSNIRKMRLLDKVRIVSAFHGMNRVFELTAMTLNLNEPSRDEFTFGASAKYSLVAGTNKTGSSVKKVVDNNVTIQQVVNVVQEQTEGKQDVLTPGDNVTIVVEDEQTIISADLSHKQNKLESDGSIKLTDLENGHTKIGARVFWNTTAYWDIQTLLESEPGAVYVYSDHYTDENGTVPGIKIGTGNAFVVDLPFVDRVYANHIMDTLVHITDSERQYWNDKVTCYIDPLNDKNLIFSKEEEPNG
ncbi:MAG TPA: hypothetical protein DHV37_05790 [Erysipelotrichaceae bacterium]|nr:hypothetical protein [Erysipelotrichaceae bacterium]